MLEVIVRSAVFFGVLLLITRLLGKKQLSHLTFFNYVAGITIGSIAATLSVDKNIQLKEGIAALLIWGLLTVTAGYIGLKSPRARIIIDGEPTIVIKNGNIDKKALASLRMNMDDLIMLIRNNNIFSVKEIDYAILEPNGNLSVLKKPEKQYSTKEDLLTSRPIIQPRLYFPSELIVDGKVVKRNLRELNLDEEWLTLQLKQAQTTVDNVFYAEVQSDGSLYINKKEQAH